MAQYVLHSIKNAPGQGIFLSSTSSLQLNVFYDANWARYQDTHKLTIDYYIFIGRSLISWKTKKKVIVSHLSAKAEYHYMVTIYCEVTWLQNIFRDLAIKQS